MAKHDPCPFCGAGDTRLTDSRVRPLGRFRRRICQECGQRWSTLEITLDSGIRAPAALLRRTMRGAEDIAEDLRLLLTLFPDEEGGEAP